MRSKFANAADHANIPSSCLSSSLDCSFCGSNACDTGLATAARATMSFTAAAAIALVAASLTGLHVAAAYAAVLVPVSAATQLLWWQHSHCCADYSRVRTTILVT